MVPGSRGKGRQHQRVRRVHAGIELRTVGIVGIAQDLRKHDHAVQVDRILGFQHVGQRAGTRGAVAFAKQVFRRIPAPVLGQELADELGKSLHVAIDAIKLLFAFLALFLFLRLVLVGKLQSAETGAGRIDEYEVAGIEQAVFVVDDVVRRSRRVLIVRGHHALGPERAHVQPYRGRARSAVVEKSQRAFFIVLALLEIGDIEDAGGRVVLVLVLAGQQDGAGHGLVGNALAADAYAAFTGLAFRPQRRCVGLGIGFLVCGCICGQYRRRQDARQRDHNPLWKFVHFIPGGKIDGAARCCVLRGKSIVDLSGDHAPKVTRQEFGA